MKRVHIKICDEGWIIEKLACKLADQLDYVDFSLDDRDDAELTYHLPYLTFESRRSQAVLGFFTHLEQDEVRVSHFWRAAGAFDHCVSMSNRYATLLQSRGIAQVSVISPGVDLEAFTPEIRIGVVGRTYDSGRKGEGLIKQVLDLPGIRWMFTGRGWPVEPQFVADSEMPDFYRSIDYLLVPSSIEGGPMCVPEALACGKEVIAPDVGWVNEFPHISYATGDAASLRNVLLGLFRKRLQLRESVLSRTWQSWIDQHDRLFFRYLSRCP